MTEELAGKIKKAIDETKVGERISFKFANSGVYTIVRMDFYGGWSVEQTLPPGGELNLVRGDDTHPISITIEYRKFEGIS